MQKGVRVLLRLTNDEGNVVVVNFANVLFMERSEDEESEYTIISVVDGINIRVQDDLDEILASYRREWKNA
jgi:hypothetical protein